MPACHWQHDNERTVSLPVSPFLFSLSLSLSLSLPDCTAQRSASYETCAVTAQTIVKQRRGSEKESEREEGVRERKVCTLTNQSSSGLHHHGTLVGMRHHGTRVVFAFVLCAIAAHSSSLPFIVCAITGTLVVCVCVVCASTAHSSSVFASSAPSRHTPPRRLHHHGTSFGS